MNNSVSFSSLARSVSEKHGIPLAKANGILDTVLREMSTTMGGNISAPSGHVFGARLKRRRNYRTPKMESVAFVDLDGLHAVNSIHGYGAGNVLIRKTLEALHSVCRMEDIRRPDYGRWFEGDEFVVVVQNITAKSLRDRIVGALESHGVSGTVATVRRGRGEEVFNAVARAAELVKESKKKTSQRSIAG